MSEVITGKDIGIKAVRGHLMTTKEVAIFLRVSERWVRAHMADCTFPLRWFPVGSRVRLVDSADLNDWLPKIFVEAGTAPLPLKAERKLKRRRKGVRVK